jgi:hypothetical protein
METQNLSDQAAIRSGEWPRHTLRRRQWLIGIGLALIALIAVWAMVLAAAGIKAWVHCQDKNLNGTQCSWDKNQFANTFWNEGGAIPHVNWIDGLAAIPTHTFQWSTSWSSSSVYHGFDWMTSWAQAQQTHQDYMGRPLDLNACAYGNAAIIAACTSLRNAYSITINIPDDNYVSGGYLVHGRVLDRIQYFESKYGNRTMTLYSDAPISATAYLTSVHTTDDGNYTPVANGGDTALADSIIRWTLIFTSPGSTQFMLEYGLHFALSGNPYMDPLAWGWDVNNKGYGAGGLYPTGSWHVKEPVLVGEGSLGSVDMQAKVNNPNSYPINSNSTWTTPPNHATDQINMASSSNVDISGTIAFYVCSDTTVPYTDTLSQGCSYTDTFTYVGSVSLTVNANNSTATSPIYTPTVSGRYCFAAYYLPSYTSVNPFDYPPTVDSNGTTECFMAQGPNAITLADFKVNAAGDGAPIIALLLSLLAVIAGATVWALGRRRRQAIP